MVVEQVREADYPANKVIQLYRLQSPKLTLVYSGLTDGSQAIMIFCPWILMYLNYYMVEAKS